MLKPELELDNHRLLVRNIDTRLKRAIESATSYLHPGRFFSPAYQKKRWDGLVRLFRWSERTECYWCPSGLVDDVMRVLRENDYPKVDFIDSRSGPHTHVDYRWSDSLRPHQERAVAAATEPRGPLGQRGRCMIVMAIRGGKTRAAGGIIGALKVRSLFLVNSKILLGQAREALADRLHVKVGQVGDGVWEPRDCTVATLQSLVLRQGGRRKVRGTEDEYEKVKIDPKYVELLNSVDLVIFDECHHLEAGKWRAVLDHTNAIYRIGLTATLNEAESDLHLHGATGPVVCRVTPSELIDAGFLIRPDVRLYPIREPVISHWKKWSPKLIDDLVFKNDHRNARIAEVTHGLVKDEGLRVIVHAERLAHVDELVTRLRARGLRTEKMIGETTRAARDKLLRKLTNRGLDCLVSNVLGEGVDVPALEACVNAAGGADRKMAMQKLRCLTPAAGKDKAVYVDFLDMTHPIFAEHTQARLDVYRSERAFHVRVCAS